MVTGWTPGMDKRIFFYFSDNIEIACLEQSTLWCPEINQSKSDWHSGTADDFHDPNTINFHFTADFAYF